MDQVEADGHRDKARESGLHSCGRVQRTGISGRGPALIPSESGSVRSVPIRDLLGEEVAVDARGCVCDQIVPNRACVVHREVENMPAESDVSQPDSYTAIVQQPYGYTRIFLHRYVLVLFRRLGAGRIGADLWQQIGAYCRKIGNQGLKIGGRKIARNRD